MRSGITATASQRQQLDKAKSMQLFGFPKRLAVKR
jgi:hypothetical protein